MTHCGFVSTVPNDAALCTQRCIPLVRARAHQFLRSVQEYTTFASEVNEVLLGDTMRQIAGRGVLHETLSTYVAKTSDLCNTIHDHLDFMRIVLDFANRENIENIAVLATLFVTNLEHQVHDLRTFQTFLEKQVVNE